MRVYITYKEIGRASRMTISIVRRGIRDGGREGGMEGRRGGCMSYFLQVAINEWTDTNPVLSPPAALNSGAFQQRGYPHAQNRQHRLVRDQGIHRFIQINQKQLEIQHNTVKSDQGSQSLSVCECFSVQCLVFQDSFTHIRFKVRSQRNAKALIDAHRASYYLHKRHEIRIVRVFCSKFV